MATAPKLKYADIRQQIRPGDLLLFRGERPFARLIRWWTHTPYSHVEICLSLEGRVCSMGAVIGRGVFPQLVSQKLARYKGVVEWWASPTGPQSRSHAQRWLLSPETGWGSRYASARQFWRAFLFGRAWDQPDAFFCSEYAARFAYEVLGLLPFKDAIHIEPADFARAPFEFRGVLTL